MIVWRYCCSAHEGSELCHYVGVWWNGTHCVYFDVVKAVIHCLWTSRVGSSLILRMGVLENQDAAVVGVGSSFPAKLPVHQVNTSCSNYHTPVADMIRWVWLPVHQVNTSSVALV